MACALPRHERVSFRNGHTPDGSSAPRIRRRHRRRRRRSLTYAIVIPGLVVATFALAAFVVLDSSNSATDQENPSETDRIIDRSALGRDDTPGVARPVYRHSVVPGGIYSVGEAVDATGRDAVAAAHYNDVDLPALTVEELPAARRAYVSYRVRDRIYWTRHTVELQAGETILTDGRNMIRARCGNRVSTHPQAPTADDEPVPAELDVVDLVLFEPDQPIADQPAIRPGPRAAFLSLPGTLLPRAARQYESTSELFPDSPPLHSPLGLEPPDTASRQREPARQVPEPGTLLLAGMGLAGIAIRQLAGRRAHR